MSEFNRPTSTVISNAQNLLMEQATQNPTASLIKEMVELAASIMPRREDEPIDIEGAIAELIRRYSIWIGKNSTLSDDSDHETWLGSSRKKGWRYWPRYRDMLERKMPPAAIDALEISTDEVLGLLEDPNRTGSWDRRGLVVGHVQSGKTANYTGLICKAADAGYKIIIILAGLHNNLRSQTQIRLEEGFLGYETSANNDVVRIYSCYRNDCCVSHGYLVPPLFLKGSALSDVRSSQLLCRLQIRITVCAAHINDANPQYHS